MPHKSKLASKEKVKIVQDILAGKLTVGNISRRLGICKSTVKAWIRLYETEGETGLIPQKRNRVYPQNLKLSAVGDYLCGLGSLGQICAKYKIKTREILRKWIKLYNSHEEFRTFWGGSRMTKTRNTTQCERLDIVHYCLANNKDYGKTAIKYNVSYQQVYTWVRRFKEMGYAGLEDRRGKRSGTLPSRTPEEALRDKVAQLERKNFDLRMENAVLKKLQELERRDALALQETKGNTKR